MKRIGWLICALSVVFVAFAPTAQAGGEGKEKKEGPQTIQGCLSDGEGEGWYVLTKKKGDETKEIQVKGNDSFEAHVGHEVKLTGTWEEAEGEKHFNATAMEHVAASCS